MAGASLGGAFLSAALQVLFDRMASREVVDFIRGKKLEKGMGSKLEEILVRLQHLVNQKGHLGLKECRGGETLSQRELVLDKCDALQMEALPCGLRELRIANLKINDSIMEKMLQPCTSLEQLEIWSCVELRSLPEGSSLPMTLKKLRISASNVLNDSKIIIYTSLESLYIYKSRCHVVESFPLGAFPLLNDLEVRNCEELKRIVGALEGDNAPLSSSCSLKSLWIDNCSNFICFHKLEGLCSPSLTSLYLCFCENLKALPEQMHSLFPSLEKLWIEKCPKIEGFPKDGLPSKLQSLWIGVGGGCRKLIEGMMKSDRELGSQSLPSLTFLFINGGDEIEGVYMEKVELAAIG
ncbi:putative disease resistance RPP13-like protein 1-like protein [Corchorus olitorius]|uniref:Disease resistance RPP13-like protein 1-like protein n=1 Tax=Corchorus olitorius TaxID=93759 RepID=A0A1R3K9Q9_9ROSI|nr:putative disease resistance RPP13-like protein 1-like protein [Corchorus olitorius]